MTDQTIPYSEYDYNIMKLNDKIREVFKIYYYMIDLYGVDMYLETCLCEVEKLL